MSYSYSDNQTVITIEEPVTWSTESKEKHWYRVILNESSIYRVDVNKLNIVDQEDIVNDLDITVHNPRFVDAGYIWDEVPGDVVPYANGLAFMPTATAVYFISVSPRAGTVGEYRLSVEADIVDTVSTVGEVIVGSFTPEVIETRLDQDWFRVSLLAGHQYKIDLEGAPSVHGALPDPYLRGIYDVNGNPIPGTTNDDVASGHLNSHVLFTPATSGEYFISAGAYGVNTGSYKLSVEGDDDFAGDWTTAGRVYSDGPVKGGIQSTGDLDWFRVSLQVGEIRRISVEGEPTQKGTLKDPYLFGIYDSNGQLLPKTTDDNGGLDRNAHLLFTPEVSGDYYISVGGFGTSIGSYELSAEPDYLLS